MSFTLKGLIYGEPGIGKTTLAISAPKSFIIDTENGLHRVNGEYKALVGNRTVATYKEILDLINGDALDKYETIVIDTLSNLVNKIGDYAAGQNPKLRQGNGQLTMQGYGQVKLLFSAFLKLLDSKGKSVIFVAHESEEKDGEVVKKRPDCSGSARKDIVKELDFMGYMSKNGNKTTIDFNPSQSYYAKNSINLPDFVEIPKIKGLNNFLAKNVFEKAKDKKYEEAEISAKFSSLINNIQLQINELATVEDVNRYYKEDYNNGEEIWSSFAYEKEMLNEKIKDLGFQFDTKAKLFFDPKPKSKTGLLAEAPIAELEGIQHTIVA